MRSLFPMVALAGLLLLGKAFGAEQGAARRTPTDVAKQDQNPIARVLRVQIEDNLQFGIGPDDKAINFLRIQPVVAFGLGKRWSLVLRAILPIVHQSWPQPATGLGDIGLQLFFSPKRDDGLLWGVGPGFFFPSASDEIIGTEKWSAGPSGVVLYSKGPWLVGVLVNQLWSFAGDDTRRSVDVMTLRPILNYNLPKGWYFTSSPSIAASWKAPKGDRWLVPVGAGLGKAFVLGSYGLTTTAEAYTHVLSPAPGPDWQLRFQVSVLFPK